MQSWNQEESNHLKLSSQYTSPPRASLRTARQSARTGCSSRNGHLTSGGLSPTRSVSLRRTRNQVWVFVRVLFCQLPSKTIILYQWKYQLPALRVFLLWVEMFALHHQGQMSASENGFFGLGKNYETSSALTRKALQILSRSVKLISKTYLYFLQDPKGFSPQKAGNQFTKRNPPLMHQALLPVMWFTCSSTEFYF